MSHNELLMTIDWEEDIEWHKKAAENRKHEKIEERRENIIFTKGVLGGVDKHNRIVVQGAIELKDAVVNQEQDAEIE